MKFSVSDSVFANHPEAIIGIITAKNIDNSGEDVNLKNILKDAEHSVRKDFNLDNLSKEPAIQNWKQAYKSFGSKKERASHEALIRRVLKGDSIPHISKLVDAYNAISLKYRLPAGGEDLSKITSWITLKHADGVEKFVQLGSREESSPDEGEIVYCDGKEVLCRKWNWRESDNTKLTEETKEAFLVLEALPPVTEPELRKALQELEEMLNKYCNADTEIFVVNLQNKEIEF